MKHKSLLKNIAGRWLAEYDTLVLADHGLPSTSGQQSWDCTVALGVRGRCGLCMWFTLTG